MEQLATLLAEAGSAILVWFGIFTRVAAVAFLLPGIGERAVPARIKLGGALSLSIIVAPMVIGQIPDIATTPADTFRVVATEAFAGLFIGVSIRLLVFVVQIAGTVAAQSLAVAQMFGGVSGPEPEPIIASFLTLAVIALALTTGLHVKVALALAASYQIAPFGLALPAEDVGQWAADSGSAAIDMAIGLALPFLVLSFLYNFALGAINRAMPQLMVAFIGAPAITGMGIGLLLLVTPVFFEVWLSAFDIVIADPFGVMP